MRHLSVEGTLDQSLGELLKKAVLTEEVVRLLVVFQ
jgi:hypothetical protein